MKLYFKQRFFSWFDSYDIYAEDGSVLFTVEGQLSWGHMLHILNAQGEHIATVKQVVLTWLPKFELGYRHAYELGERFNGLSVGISIPLFANRKKVKMAKAQALAGSFAVNNREQQALAELQTAYDEAVSLQQDHARYDLLMRQNNLGLLQKALTAGQISMVEYLVDATQLYEAFDNRLSLEYEYQLRLARMYKFEL